MDHSYLFKQDEFEYYCRSYINLVDRAKLMSNII